MNIYYIKMKINVTWNSERNVNRIAQRIGSTVEVSFQILPIESIFAFVQRFNTADNSDQPNWNSLAAMSHVQIVGFLGGGGVGRERILWKVFEKHSLTNCVTSIHGPLAWKMPKIKTILWGDHFPSIEIHYNGTKIIFSVSTFTHKRLPPKKNPTCLFFLLLVILWMRNIDSVYNKWTSPTTCVAAFRPCFRKSWWNHQM